MVFYAAYPYLVSPLIDETSNVKISLRISSFSASRFLILKRFDRSKQRRHFLLHYAKLHGVQAKNWRCIIATPVEPPKRTVWTVCQDNKVRMYYGSGTVAHTANHWCHTRSASLREAGDTAAIRSSERLADVMAAILKVWRHIRNPTQSIDTYLPEEQSCLISSWSGLKRRNLTLF